MENWTWDWFQSYVELNASLILAFGLVAFLVLSGALYRPNIAKVVCQFALGIVTLGILIVAVMVALNFFAII